MAKPISAEAQEAITYLPEKGEITYDAWKQALQTAGKAWLVPWTRRAKECGIAVYRLQQEDNGSMTLMVSRA